MARQTAYRERNHALAALAVGAHGLALLAALPLTLLMKDPLLLWMRAGAWPLLLIASMAGMAAALALPPRRRAGQAVLLLAWLAVLSSACYREVEYCARQRRVETATGEDAQTLRRVGEHLVVGYRSPADLRQLVTRGYIGGVIVRQDNAAGRARQQLRAEIDALQALRRRAGLPPLLIAADQEGGAVAHLSPPLPRQPPLATLVASGARGAALRQLAMSYGFEQGAALRAVGVNTNFSPVVDLKPVRGSIALDFFSRIASRAIASDPATVTEVALAYSQGLAAQGIVPTLKHFPGLGSATADTHRFNAELTQTIAQLEAADWRPFRAILRRTEALLMVGHATLNAVEPGLPASVSGKLIDQIVRRHWGHEGVIISDDLTMAPTYRRGLCDSSLRALGAGTDLLLLAYDWQQIYTVLDCLLSAATGGRLPDLTASKARLSQLPWRAAAAPGADPQRSHDADITPSLSTYWKSNAPP